MSTDLVVNPDTGEVLENLDKQPAESLAETLNAINLREAELKRWRGPLEGELRRRLRLRQKRLDIFGEWEVEAASTRERLWDADALESAMRQLVDEGVLPAGELTGVITREPVVSKSRAKAVLDRLDGGAAEAIAACFVWRDKQGRLTVTRSVDLLAAGEAPQEGDVRAATTDVSPGPTPAPAESPRPPEGGTSPARGDNASVAAGHPAGTAQPASTLDPEELFA